MLHYLKTKLKQYHVSEEGTATVEFMFAMPLVMFWVAGSFAFFNAFSEYTKAVKATYTVADILSRQDEVNDAYIDSMNMLFANFMREDTNDVWLRVSSIEKVGDELSVGWSTATGANLELVDVDDIPSEIIPDLVDEESIILVETFVSFVPFLDYIGLEERTFANKVVVTPRWVSPLANVDS